MLHIRRLDDGIEVFKALGSELRIQILKLLLENKEMNMNELAVSLGITNGALTSHIRKLEEAGLVTTAVEHGGHGNQKRCRVAVDKVLLEIAAEPSGEETCETEIRIGHYSNYEVYPTCGIATTEEVIGVVDDPRYFAYPNRVNAGVLWFGRGYIEYRIPNLLPNGTKLDRITLSAELSSEAPGVNSDWPSDISFFLNDREIGVWTSPGDYGDIKGIFTPDWWYPGWNQYGLLKMVEINERGTFVDGLKISDVSIREMALDYRSTLCFRFQVSENARHVGGLTLFGRGYGNYNQDIRVRLSYSPIQTGGTQL